MVSCLSGGEEGGEALLKEGGRDVLVCGCSDGGTFPSLQHKVEKHAEEEQAVPGEEVGGG